MIAQDISIGRGERAIAVILVEHPYILAHDLDTVLMVRSPPEVVTSHFLDTFNATIAYGRGQE